MKRVLTIRVDVTDLRPKEVDALTGEVVAQCERGDDHPDAPVLGIAVRTYGKRGTYRRGRP